jgi:hypothetical protein
MSIDRTTYAFIGVHVPASQYGDRYVGDETDRLDDVIRDFGVAGLGHLTAGPYDEDELFLVVGEAYEVEPGEFLKLDSRPISPEAVVAVNELAARAGYGDIGPVGWIVVSHVG